MLQRCLAGSPAAAAAAKRFICAVDVLMAAEHCESPSPVLTVCFSAIPAQLGLQDGTSYPVDIFMAQRHGPGVSPTLDVTTSVDFASGKTTAAYCAGAAAATPPDVGSNTDTSLGEQTGENASTDWHPLVRFL